MWIISAAMQAQKERKKLVGEERRQNNKNSERCQGDMDPFVSVLLSIRTVIGPVDVDKGELNKRN